MFVKFEVNASAVQKPFSAFNVIVHCSMSNTRLVIKFDANDTTTCKDVVLSLFDHEDVSVTALFDGAFKESQTVVFNATNFTPFQNHNFIPVNIRGLEVNAHFSVLERVPADWVDRGISLLGDEPRAWYFKGEDIYTFIKQVLNSIQNKNTPSFDCVCKAIDYVTLQVGRKFVVLDVEEGFSIVKHIDDALEHILTRADGIIDIARVHLALALQKLRRQLTAFIEYAYGKVAAHAEVIKAQVSVMSAKHAWLANVVTGTIEWASEKADFATTWMAQEKEEVYRYVNVLQENGTNVLHRAQDTISHAPSDVYHLVATEVDHAQVRIRAIPEIAHPYVLTAISAAQPIVHTAIATATPIIQSLKTPLVENLILDTQDTLERHRAMNSLISAVSSCATTVYHEVTEYCTNDKYFEREEVSQPYVPHDDDVDVVKSNRIVSPVEETIINHDDGLVDTDEQ